jgi:hypothetical protein
MLKVLQKDKTDFDYNVVINSRDTLKMPTGNIEYRVEENKVDKLGKNQSIASVYENNIKVYEFPFSLNTGKLIKEYTLVKDVKKGESYKEDKVSVKSEMVYEETKLKNLEINCCVYCHTQGTYVVNEYYKRNHKPHKKGDLKAQKAFFELDHYYPKSKYPFLCVSFYNLIPSSITTSSPSFCIFLSNSVFTLL